jgi:hypothetical protein
MLVVYSAAGGIKGTERGDGDGLKVRMQHLLPNVSLFLVYSGHD